MTLAHTEIGTGLAKAADEQPKAFLLPLWRDLVKGAGFESFAEAARKRHQLTYLTIDTTGACDLKCTGMCYYNPEISLRRPFAPESALRDAIREASVDLSMKVLAFAGKEPFLNPDRLFSLLKSAGTGDQRAFITGIVTNGRHIHRHHERLRMAAGEGWLDYIDISIDTADEQQHDSFRGLKGTHRLALEAVQWVRSELETVRPTVVSVLRWDNSQGILDLISKLSQSITYYQIQPIQPPPYSSIPPLNATRIIDFVASLKNLLAGPLNGCGLNVSIELLGIYLVEAVTAGLFRWSDIREDDNQTLYVEMNVGGNALVITCEVFPLQAWRLARIAYTGAYLAHMHFLQAPDPDRYAVGFLGQEQIGTLFDRAMAPESPFERLLESRQVHDCHMRPCWSNCFGGWNGAENAILEKGRKLSAQPRLCDKTSNDFVILQSSPIFTQQPPCAG